MGETTLHAPDHRLAEATTALCAKCMVAKALTREEASAGIQLFADVVVEETPIRELIEAASDMAFVLQLTIYDTLYVALAARIGVPVVTADQKLFARAKTDLRYADSVVWIADLPMANAAASPSWRAAGNHFPDSGRGCYGPGMPSLDMELAAGGRVAGVDEVGRGPLAGPVVAAAVVLPADLSADVAGLLDDSKKLTAEQRLAAFAALHETRAEIAVGAASVTEILRLNILHASMLAMRRAVSRLRVAPDLALVDGNYPPKLDCPVRCVVEGDALCLSIAAASIVAKVIRDRAMIRLAARWPGYGWETNVGYATALHRAALQQLGSTRHHREAFRSVAQLQLTLSVVD